MAGQALLDYLGGSGRLKTHQNPRDYFAQGVAYLELHLEVAAGLLPADHPEAVMGFSDWFFGELGAPPAGFKLPLAWVENYFSATLSPEPGWTANGMFIQGVRFAETHHEVGAALAAGPVPSAPVTAAPVAPPPAVDLRRIDTPFNACMHKAHCVQMQRVAELDPKLVPTLRPSFERWYRAHTGRLDANWFGATPAGRYFLEEVQTSWEGFLGALALAAAEQAGRPAQAWEMHLDGAGWRACDQATYEAAVSGGIPARELISRELVGLAPVLGNPPTSSEVRALAQGWGEIGEQLKKGGSTDRAAGAAYLHCAEALVPGPVPSVPVTYDEDRVQGVWVGRSSVSASAHACPVVPTPQQISETVPRVDIDFWPAWMTENPSLFVQRVVGFLDEYAADEWDCRIGRFVCRTRLTAIRRPTAADPVTPSPATPVAAKDKSIPVSELLVWAVEDGVMPMHKVCDINLQDALEKFARRFATTPGTKEIS